MNLLIIGDVHGCSHTLKKLVKEHWNPQGDILIQLGDLVNKGPNSAGCIKYWQKLEGKYGTKQVVMLRGNHEQSFITDGGDQPKLQENIKLRKSVIRKGLNPEAVRNWFTSLPLSWENSNVLITHAGIAAKGKDWLSEFNKNGVLYNKGPLLPLDKVQVKGHSIVAGDKPVFVPRENAWYIDTGAWTKKYLSAIRLSPKGELMDVIRVKTQTKDKS